VQNTVVYTPWTFFSDGCKPNCEIGPAIQAAGFASVDFNRWMQDGSGVISAVTKPHICGVAIR
jgi:hypothetical protein